GGSRPWPWTAAPPGALVAAACTPRATAAPASCCAGTAPRAASPGSGTPPPSPSSSGSCNDSPSTKHTKQDQFNNEPVLLHPLQCLALVVGARVFDEALL